MRAPISKAGCLLGVGLALGLAAPGSARDKNPPAQLTARSATAAQAAHSGQQASEQLGAKQLAAKPLAPAPGEPPQLDAKQLELGPLQTSPLASTGASSPLDPAVAAARAIARRVRTFHSFRSEIPLATWRTDGRAQWRVRTGSRCLAAAAKLRVPALPLERAFVTPVPAPVVLTGPVGGVSFRPVQSDRDIELSCELATRLPALSALLRSHGVRVAHVNSSYREQPRVSFHTFGLALDIAAFETTSGPLVVATDFELAPGVETCQATPSTERGRALLELACAIAKSGLFSSVLTPNYNVGHRDHFHLDIRPDDKRLFVR